MHTKKSLQLKTNDGYYFPLFNLNGLRSSITPFFGGDLKLDQHHYALQPTTEVDLYNNIFSRNIIFKINDQQYFLNGQTNIQQNDELIYETDLLYQRVIRTNSLFKLDTTSYIPVDANIEIHEIQITNQSDSPFQIDITTAIPIYGRSADNLRDHRHVTSLLNQIEVAEHGIFVQPTLSFDERGHQINDTVYSVFAESNDLKIKGYIPVLDDFVNGGSLHFPKGLDNLSTVGTKVNGYEAIGAIAFHEIKILPFQSITLYVSIGIHQSKESALKDHKKYLSQASFSKGLNQASEFFQSYVQGLSFDFHDLETSKQLSWVVLQPMLRRYFGNSFLPHHDYGHGGRGWRDLWQDLLSLIMMNDDSVIDLLYDNFQGVRIDGSNATIIGDQPGEFKADRNLITRVWSDHGAWPLLTTKMYLDETGDIDFLLKKQSYFMDQFTHYTKKTREKTTQNLQLTAENEVYQGTILEHLLLQNLVGHHNVGKHGFVKLEDADWNDGLDMAHQHGETIAFTHMYANNLRELAKLVQKLNVKEIQVFKELKGLLTLTPDLIHYFDSVAQFSGEIINISSQDLSNILLDLAEERIKKLHQDAFNQDRFQSYFDNDGKNPDHKETIALTGQTMALLSKTATSNQAGLVGSTVRNMLFDQSIGGYKLNTNYQKLMTNMGRAYGFAYGHKENGAVFAHMAVMYAYGLYQYDLVSYGHEAIITLLKQAQNPRSKVLHGIPEYFNDRGIGMYPYLTGSASWMLKLLRTEVFGVQFDLGVLTLKPKLKSEDFINGRAIITTYLFNKLRKVIYHNPKNLDFGFYKISKILVNGKEIDNNIREIDDDIEVHLDEIL
ncbi:MAG: cellobiose phosphorylase [Tenericutes bacterium]|nr:cellobiose phosphorylase [Mycoplasmatota bacterium]